MIGVKALWSHFHDNGAVMTNPLTRIFSILIVGCGICATAQADIWRWTDAQGKIHFVDSDTPIYTWLDEMGKVHYSDTPDHYSAVKVELVWHSPNSSLPNESPIGTKTPVVKRQQYIPPGETEGERHEREQAEAYYCKRAREIYDSYLSAPRLYKTDSDGNRVYLSESEGAELLADTEMKVDALCH